MSAQSYANLVLTMVATAAITACRFVTAGGTVTVADANSCGVSRSAAAIGENFAYDAGGTTIVESGAAVTVNASVKSDSTGRAIDWATSGVKLGQALQAATAAGQFIEVRLMPNVV